MAIIGIGMDIVEIARIEAVVARSGTRLARRILSQTEWMQYQKQNQQVRFLAKCFSVKEAASKALGVGICSGLSFAQFELLHDALGKPLLRLFGKAADVATSLNVSGMFITLADERHYACATVIFER